VRFTVAGKGGRIAGFRADAPTVCSSTTSPTGAEPGSSAAERPLVELAQDGDFGVDGTHADHAALQGPGEGPQAHRRTSGDPHVVVRG
jgi:hypothetical protein